MEWADQVERQDLILIEGALGFEKVEEQSEELVPERGGGDSKMVQLMMQVHERGKILYGPERMVRVSMLVLRFDIGSRNH